MLRMFTLSEVLSEKVNPFFLLQFNFMLTRVYFLDNNFANLRYLAHLT